MGDPFHLSLHILISDWKNDQCSISCKSTVKEMESVAEDKLEEEKREEEHVASQAH